MGGAVEGEGGAGPLVSGGLGDDDGPVVDASVVEGLLGDPLGLVEAGTDLQVDLFDEPVLDVDDAAGGIRRWGEHGHAETPTHPWVVAGQHDEGAGVVDASQQQRHLTGGDDVGVGDRPLDPQGDASLRIQPAGGFNEVDGVTAEVCGAADVTSAPSGTRWRWTAGRRGWSPPPTEASSPHETIRPGPASTSAGGCSMAALVLTTRPARTQLATSHPTPGSPNQGR